MIPSNYQSFALRVQSCIYPCFLVFRRMKRRHFQIKWEGKMDNKLKIRFSKIHRKEGFKESWTSKFFWKKKGLLLLSTCCNMRIRSHTKAFKFPHYVKRAGHQKGCLKSNEQKSIFRVSEALDSMFAGQLLYYRIQKNYFTNF